MGPRHIPTAPSAIKARPGRELCNRIQSFDLGTRRLKPSLVNKSHVRTYILYYYLSTLHRNLSAKCAPEPRVQCSSLATSEQTVTDFLASADLDLASADLVNGVSHEVAYPLSSGPTSLSRSDRQRNRRRIAGPSKAQVYFSSPLPRLSRHTFPCSLGPGCPGL